MSVLAAATAGLRRCLDLLLFALIVVVIFGLVLGKLVPLTGRQTMIVGGASMEPAIGLGAAAIIAPVTADELAIGDIVSLRAGEKNAIFTHRIVSIVDRPDGRWIGTKGDANAEPDPTIVPASSVVGRSELSIPYAGYLLQLMSMPTGVLFLVGLAITLLAAAWLLESLELDRAADGSASLRPALDSGRDGPVDAPGPATRPAGASLAALRAERQRRSPITGSLRRAPRRSR